MSLRVPHSMVVYAYTEAAIITRGNDISEEPMTQRWKGGTGRRRESREALPTGFVLPPGDAW